ncbi:beta strand repeat-containing protein [Hansschlegelia plantiphila]|uniref:Calcium-binding protein n=1 Tax=Hansschlegelia plantiphila TaxID=374655 RepID=A0A9W6MU99_9HYPH|nr:calcium-binding protein [Hansschlegelia plantiphila]GLK66445.1 hypothetical protein GCM10008179_00830 [Hansschlegelia plantiphila]
MALLDLDLGGLLDDLEDTINGVLGGDLGAVVTEIAPGNLINDLGDTLSNALGGEPTGLLSGLLDANLIDVGQLQSLLDGGPGGTLDLGALGDLVSGDTGLLGGVLDLVFDTDLLGHTVIDQAALQDLSAADLADVVTYVTNVVGAVLSTPSEGLDVDNVLTTVLTGDDDVTGTERDNTLRGGAGNDEIHGMGGDDAMSGGAGQDTLDGGAGADTMSGGSGDDIYYVDNAGDQVREANEQGVDTVNSSVAFSLAGQYIENLTLTGSANIAGTGNSLDNVITGNAGNNVLDGATGADTMAGGAGNDTYYADNAGDRVIEAGDAGTDKVISSVSFSLTGQYVENLNLTGSADINGTGNSLDNVITGNAGDNVLDGFTGADQMSGGAGDDTYYVDNAGDRAFEAKNGGFDQVISSVSYALSAQYVENLSLTGSGDIDGLGNSLDNVISGTTGDNVINGWTGADTMTGLAGNDTYYVDNASDVVIEANRGGTDTVNSSVSFSLAGQYVENLNLTGSDDIDGAGNSLDNVITGNAGDNAIDGGFGADTMSGGAGDDTYYVQNTGDTAVEGRGGGVDTVNSTVSYALTGQYVENLNLTGSGNTNALGNSLDNTIVGNSGKNVIDGSSGSDVLTGGAGRDTFVFDTKLGASNVDHITDFSVADDTIRLDHTVFAGLTTGGLSADAFTAGAAAHDASDRIIYNSSTGALLFDRDGTGSASAVQFATLGDHLALTNADFTVV